MREVFLLPELNSVSCKFAFPKAVLPYNKKVGILMRKRLNHYQQQKNHRSITAVKKVLWQKK